MNPDKLFDLVHNELQANHEFRVEMMRAIGEIKTELAVLKSQRDSGSTGFRLAGWILVFFLNIASVAASYLISKP